MAKKTTPKRPQPRTKKAPARKTAAGAPRPAALPVYHVDAFTSRPYHGNPAAVVIVDQKRWPDDDAMQSIAAELHLPMTAFVRKPTASGVTSIRWMTPTSEFSLCGHATLAAAHVLWEHQGVKSPRLVFDSRSGKIPVGRNGDLIVLDFAACTGKPVAVSDAVCSALGRAPVECVRESGGKLMCVFENRRDIYGLAPDMAGIAALEDSGVIVTAPGSGHDFVSRYFAPKMGIDEDWVSGSTHCMLVPYWAHVLGKQSLTAHQTSRRGGELFCHLRGKRVHIGGHAVTFSEGKISV